VRDVWFGDELKPARTPVYARSSLAPGARVSGPAIIEQVDSTIAVPPETSAVADEWLNIRIDVGGW
jgi:N-methylhydantoinase A